jgi:flagellar biosynthesis/type III secretory pathway M-ring protein FliF/YscJ
MSISSEIEKLSVLREKGILNESEFQVAKNKLLNTMGAEHNTGTGVNKIGNAAVSWVNLQWVSYAVGLMAAALIVFYFFIPHWQKMQKSEEAFNKTFEATKKEIEEAHKDMDIRNKEFDKDFQKKKNEMEDFRKKNFGN